MGKTHDDDEVEIDLRELFYALKKHILIILAALLVGAVIAGAATKIFITPVYNAGSDKGDNTLLTGRSSDWQPVNKRLQYSDHKPYGIAGCCR